MKKRVFAILLLIFLGFSTITPHTLGLGNSTTIQSSGLIDYPQTEGTPNMIHGAWLPPAWCVYPNIHDGSGGLQSKVYNLLDWYESIGIDTFVLCFSRFIFDSATPTASLENPVGSEQLDQKYLALIEKLVDEAYDRGMRTILYEWFVDDYPWEWLRTGSQAQFNAKIADWTTFYRNLMTHFRGNSKVLGIIPCGNTDRFCQSGNPWGYTDADVYNGNASPTWLAAMETLAAGIHQGDPTKIFFFKPMPDFGDFWCSWTSPISASGPVYYHVMTGFIHDEIYDSYYPYTSEFVNIINWKNSYNVEVLQELIIEGEEMGWGSGWTWDNAHLNWLNSFLPRLESDGFNWYWESLYDPSNSLDRRGNEGSTGERSFVQYIRDHLG